MQTNIMAILAGGTGSRFGADIPKQFLQICEKPIILYTLENCLVSKKFTHIIIAVHPDWIFFTEKLLTKFNISDDRIAIIAGGKERIESITNVVDYCDENINEKIDSILFHDAVRPFADVKLLERVLDDAVEFGASHAASACTDTMIYSSDGEFETELLDRSKIFSGLAPDGFKYDLFKNALNSLTPKERETLTGTAQIVLASGIKVKLTKADSFNFKITTAPDLQLAKAIIESKVQK